MASIIPHINLLFLRPEYTTVWEKALKNYGLSDQVAYTVHETSLSQLRGEVKFDLIVSPANSYAILDGGFDDAISRALSPKHDYAALTRYCQSVIYEKYYGFQPPGSCVLIQLPKQLLQGNGATKNVWGVEFIGHCPTMRTPSNCRWDKEVVYECIWCLLGEIDKHNRQVSREGTGRNISSILMTPLATGTGGVSAEKWAHQTALAIKHFLDAKQNSGKWSALNWNPACDIAEEVENTHAM